MLITMTMIIPPQNNNNSPYNKTNLSPTTTTKPLATPPGSKHLSRMLGCPNGGRKNMRFSHDDDDDIDDSEEEEKDSDEEKKRGDRGGET